jgi:hypothetical protein
MSTVTRAYLDQRLAMAKRCSRGNQQWPVPQTSDDLTILFCTAAHCNVLKLRL